MPPHPYTPAFLASIERTITRERLQPYLGAANQDLLRALELYEYNISLSEALYGLLHVLEVTVRNAAHEALTNSYKQATWYNLAPLSVYWKDQIAKVQKNVGTQSGKVVAGLTFGFWVDLVQVSNHVPLWVKRNLSKAFPHPGLKRATLHTRLTTIRSLRNRISHHERVLTSGNVIYAGNQEFVTLPEIVECVEWVCPEMAQWLKLHSRYGEAERILKEVSIMGISL